jgi:hypothetical protein
MRRISRSGREVEQESMCAIPEVSWLVVLSDWNLEMFGEREREREREREIVNVEPGDVPRKLLFVPKTLSVSGALHCKSLSTANCNWWRRVHMHVYRWTVTDAMAWGIAASILGVLNSFIQCEEYLGGTCLLRNEQ